MTGPWTPARRQAAADRARRHQPWLHATGPRSVAGKATSSQNALTHGRCTAKRLADRKAVMAFLRANRALLRHIRLTIRLRKQGLAWMVSAGQKMTKATNELIRHRRLSGLAAIRTSFRRECFAGSGLSWSQLRALRPTLFEPP